MLEPIENQYMLIGYITRSHGVKGEVLIISEIEAPALFDKVDLVWLQNEREDLFPARVSSVRVDQQPGRLSFFVKFEHVKDRSESEDLKGYPVYIERALVEPLIDDSNKTPDYTSFEVYDEQNRLIGTVEQVLDNPAHPILQVELEDGTQLLVPFVDEYIRSYDDENRAIRCHNLNQLIDTE